MLLSIWIAAGAVVVAILIQDAIDASKER